MLSQQIKDDLVSAMKGQDSLRVSVLRMLLSELNYKKIDLQRELEDADVTGVIAKEVKKRNEAVISYEAGGRADQAAQEKNERDILQAYLPAMMTEEEIRNQMAKIPGVRDIKDFGGVMRVVAPMFRGKADGSLVAKIVKEWLQ